MNTIPDPRDIVGILRLDSDGAWAERATDGLKEAWNDPESLATIAESCDDASRLVWFAVDLNDPGQREEMREAIATLVCWQLAVDRLATLRELAQKEEP